MNTRRTLLRGLAAGTAAALGVSRALAQDDKSTITILVGAASTMDATARIYADHLKEVLGRPTVVVSKLGAGGRLALGDLRRAAPDGRTLMVSTSSPFAIYPNIYTKLDYDPVADFTPVAGMCWFDVALATGPATGATDMKSLLAWCKAKGPAALYGAAPGNGSSSHFAGIGMSISSGLPLTVVPYKDSGVGITDIASGRLPMLITGTGALIEMHKAGRLRMIATTGPQRTSLIPEVPTFLETGLDVKIVNSVGLYGPANLSADLRSRLAGTVESMLAKPEVRSRLQAMAMAPASMTAAQLVASLAEDRKHYEMLVKRSGYVPEAA